MQTQLVTSNLGIVNPASIDDYIARGGYRALEKITRADNLLEFVEGLKSSGLIGRGGAAFPA